MKVKSIKNQLEYYKQTEYDYHVVWDKSDYTSAHFGFYNDGASKHIDALISKYKQDTCRYYKNKEK